MPLFISHLIFFFIINNIGLCSLAMCNSLLHAYYLYCSSIRVCSSFIILRDDDERIWWFCFGGFGCGG